MPRAQYYCIRYVLWPPYEQYKFNPERDRTSYLAKPGFLLIRTSMAKSLVSDKTNSAEICTSQRGGNNPNGVNGHGKQSLCMFGLLLGIQWSMRCSWLATLVKQYPDLPLTIQRHLNEGVKIKDLPHTLLKENSITISCVLLSPG